MQQLNLPEYQPIIKDIDNKKMIFDPSRQRFVALTPEEWVRQHLLNFLTVHLNYPIRLISTEQALKSSSLQKRSDILVYSKNALPLLLVECKAPNVKLLQKTFEQILIYNQTIKSPILLLSNGITHFCFRAPTADAQPSFLSEIPNYEQLLGFVES